MASTAPHAAHRALDGASVVVTRPADSAAFMRRRIRALGGTPLALPGSKLVRADDIEAARRALAQARAAQRVVFVSPAAVRFAFALEPRLRFARGTRVATVGAGTARALARHGVGEVAWPRERHDSEGLLALEALRGLNGARVLIVGAPGGRGMLARSLRAQGAHVAHAHVYQRLDAPFGPRQMQALETARGALITLVSSAHALQRLRDGLPGALFARLAAGSLVVSSARLAGLAAAADFAEIALAQGPAVRHLLNAACAALARHRL